MCVDEITELYRKCYRDCRREIKNILSEDKTNDEFDLEDKIDVAFDKLYRAQEILEKSVGRKAAKTIIYGVEREERIRPDVRRR